MIISTPEGINAYRLLSIKAALSLELKGLRHSRGSVFKLVKTEFKLKGNKQSVYDQYCSILREKGILKPVEPLTTQS
jgi:dTDP-4-dehydrorhamnose 3,5-epimerase-like enzyme